MRMECDLLIGGTEGGGGKINIVCDPPYRRAGESGGGAACAVW